MNKILFLAYAGFLTFASTRPMDMAAAPIEHWDKLAHLGAYMFFALLGSRIVSQQKQFLYVCLGIVVYSGLMEIVQSFLPGRFMSLYDLLANAAGVAIGMVVANRIFGRPKP